MPLAETLETTTVVSLALGALLILATVWVYVRHRTLGWAGLALVLFGFLLVGGSIYKNVAVSFGKDGFEAKLEQFEKVLKTVESQSAAVSTSVAELKVRNLELRDEVREMAKRPVVDPAVLDAIGLLQKRSDAIDLALGKIADPKTGIEARMKELLGTQTKEIAEKLAGGIRLR